MSGFDSNLLKLDMQITAKRLKLKDKSTNLLQDQNVKANKLNKCTKTKPLKPGLSVPTKKTSKENKAFEHAGNTKRKSQYVRRPVGYTWNRGGRLKEIRIRTQARKFLYLWITKTFGKFTYSQVQQYHIKKIKAKFFKSWKNTWWENCGEMKMIIRAEYFNRYQIYAKVWFSWKGYVEIKRKKKEMQSKAASHYSSTASKKFVNLWKIYVQLRKTKKIFYHKAYGIANKSLTRSTWRAWCRSFEQKQQNMQNYQCATSHYNALVLEKTWKSWCYHLSEQVRLKKLCRISDQKAASSLTRKHFSNWCKYTCSRRRKYALYAKARSLYNLSLKHKVVCVWWTKYEKVLEYCDKMHACQLLSLKTTKRRYFSAWTKFVALRIYQRRQQAIAQIHHRRFLLRRSFEQLKFSVVFKQGKLRMIYTAQRFYAYSLLKNSWLTWQKKIESIEEAELSELSSVAREHYRIRLQRKCFQALLSYKQWRKTRKKDLIKAESHFIVKSLPRCFEHWRRYVDDIKDLNQMKRDADKFSRELLCTKYFFLWYSAFEDAKERRTRDRMAVMMFTENTLRHHFVLWRDKIQIILSSNHSDAVARVHYRRSLLHLTIKSWKQYAENSLLRKRKLDQAECYYEESLRAGAWLAWRKYVIRNREKKKKFDRALEHNNKCLLRKSMQSWISGWNKAKAIECQAMQKHNSICREVLKKSFSDWRKFTAVAALKKESKIKALRHRRKHLQSQIFTQWQQWTALRKFRADQKKETLDRAVAALNKFKLQRCFHKWSESKDASKLQGFQLASAQHHYYNRICKVVFQAWQLYNFIVLKKKLMQRQGDVLRRNRNLRCCVEKWKEALQWRYDEINKTGDALWHWAMTLQGRCFDNWRSYVAERKRKKSRYDQAMDTRRSYMIKNGCIRMLQYHSNALAQRTQYEACQQAKARYMAYHLAWKYGKLWIEKVRKKIENRGHITRTHASDPLVNEPTFERLFRFPSPPKSSPIVKERLSSPEFFRSSEAFKPSSVIEKQRPPPRLPDFLDASLRREGLFDDYLATDVQSPLGLSPRRVTSFDISRLGEHGDATTVKNFHLDPFSSRSVSILPTHHTSESQSTRPASLSPDESKCTVELFRMKETIPSQRYVPDVNSFSNPTGVVLIPPSAFFIPSEKPTPPSPNFSVKSNQTDDLSSSSSSRTLNADSVLSDPSFEDRKETFQTFVASPSSTREELKQIYKKLQDFQKLRDQLRVLRQQKEVLQGWIDENLFTMSSSKSLDLVTVQEEYAEIDQECARISEKLLVKRPEVESLAVRVRVLSARPT